MVGYGTIYRFEFDGTCNPFGSLLTTKGKVLILKKGYSGAIIDIPHGQVSPVEIDYPTADDDIFYPLRGSMLSFKVLGGVINMDSIISEDETEYVLEYYRDNELFWTGYVSPELCEEDIFLKYPAIEFKTIDALGSLNSFYLSDTDGLRSFGLKNINNVIASLFRGTGLQYGFNTMAKVWASGFDKMVNTFEQAYIYLNVFRDNNGNFYNSSDILKSLAYLFNCIVYQDKGQWWFIKPKDLIFGITQANKYKSDGLPDGSSTIPTLNHGTDFLIISEPKRKVRRFYKEATINYKYYSSFQNLDNNFTIFQLGFTDVDIYEAKYTEDPSFLYFSLIRDGFNSDTTYKFYSKNAGIITKCYYNPSNQDYGLLLFSEGSINDYLEYVAKSVKIGDTFSLNISTITANPKIQVIINDTNAMTYKYYNIFTQTWSNSVFTNEYSYAETVSLSNIECPYDGLLTIRLFPGAVSNPTEPFETYPYLSCYHGFYVSTNSARNSNQLITTTNIKNTSIIPQNINVFNGDAQPSLLDPFGYISDFSNILNSLEAKTQNWTERDEDTEYSIQGLSIKNILNQYSDYRNIFTGTIIGKNLRFGAIYQFPVQGALANKKFFPLSMKLNERDCTADVVFMELTPNEIEGSSNNTIYDTNGNIVYQELSSFKKKIVMG